MGERITAKKKTENRITAEKEESTRESTKGTLRND
jgi:hypothetical protein